MIPSMTREERLAEQLRSEVRKSELSQNEIARRAEIDKAAISRFMSGSGMTLAAIERLAAVLGLRLVSKKK